LKHETHEYYCSTEEDRVHEGKTGGTQNYLRHSNMDKLMSHLAISPQSLLIQNLNFMAISSITTKTHQDMTRVSLVDRSEKA